MADNHPTSEAGNHPIQALSLLLSLAPPLVVPKQLTRALAPKDDMTNKPGQSNKKMLVALEKLARAKEAKWACATKKKAPLDNEAKGSKDGAGEGSSGKDVAKKPPAKHHK
ncbi:hypothetical protein RhiJN_20185 [Ceratobasidium sp. AG-Ba]|nr:hypothetical protein RhiJN_20185 [Ceratobasidium sp. AG-Ba]